MPTPSDGASVIVYVAATLGGTYTPVNGLNRYSSRRGRPLNRTPVFARVAPWVNRGQAEYSFTLTGLHMADDAGQQLIRDADAGGTSVFLRVLLDGISGFIQEVYPTQLSNDATPETLVEHGFEFTGVAAPTVYGTPDEPTITSVTPSAGQLSVAFTAPSNNGGFAITSYQYSTDNGATWNNRQTGTTASPLVITGLAGGTTYAVRIRAVNSQGAGLISNAMQGTTP